jgi:hypothetical protein
MANDARIKAEAARGNRLLATYSQALFQQQLEWRDARKREALSGMFTSCEPGGRQCVSPLGGQCADWRWSGVGRPEGRKP